MAFPVRKQNFTFTGVPMDWFDNNVVLSTLWNSLSLTFPEGEKFFVTSVKPYQDKVKSEELKKDIKNFIGQEAAHGKEHRALNKALKEQGFGNIDQLEDEVRAFLKFANKTFPPNIKLAITCALEHFTAILAEQLIIDRVHLESTHKSIRNLWAWHAVEESEHKHVAFDVYQEIYGDYVIRIVTMMLVSVALGLVVASLHVRMLVSIFSLFDIDAWRRTGEYLFVEEKFATNLLPYYLEYFKTDFHPSDNNTMKLIKERNKLIHKLYEQNI